MKKKNSPNNIQEIIKKYSFLLIVFLMVFSFLFLIKPKITQILEIRKKIENDKKTLKFLTEKTFLLESLNEADLISRSEKILKVLPEEINLPLVLGNIRAIANNEGVNISRINVNLTSDKKEELKVIGFDLTIQGNKEGIKNFLKEIEESAPLMDIKSLRIEVVDKNEEVNLKLDTYYLTLPKTLGKIDAPVVLLTEQEEKLYQDLSRFSQKFFMGEGGFEITSDQIGKENPFSF
ncbi:MAG: type 4a pilus biogenesis protein PilO [Microgenomates group bacterium]